MKDINSVLAMSSHETDPRDCDDVRPEMTCSPSAGVPEVDTQATGYANTSTLSVMDWAGRLIEMAVSAGDCDSENNVVYSFVDSDNLDSHEPTQANELRRFNMAVTSRADFDENSSQNDHKRTSFQLGSTAMNSNDITVQGYLPADVTSSLATSISETNIDTDLIDPYLLTLLTDETVADQHEPPTSGCIPTSLLSDLSKYSYADHVTLEDSMVRPCSIMSEIRHGSQYQLDNLAFPCTDQLQFEAAVSSSSVGLELGTASALTTSPAHSAGVSSLDTNTSLETPILENGPDFADAKAYSVQCSSVSDVSDSYPNLSSPKEPLLTDTAYYEILNDPSFDSRSSGHLWDSYNAIVAGELTLHEMDIATVEIISSDSCHDSQDNIPSNLIINPDILPNTESLHQQNSISWSVSEGNDLGDVTVCTIETPQPSVSHPTQLYSSEHCIDAAVTQTVSSRVQIPSNLRQEWPSQSTVTHLAHDLSHPQATRDLSLDFRSCGVDCSTGQDSHVSCVNSSRLLDLSESEFSFDNTNEYSDYCSDRDTRRLLLPAHGEGSTVGASRSLSTLHTQGRAESSVVRALTKPSRKRRVDGPATSSHTSLNECTTFSSANPVLRTTTDPKLRHEQKQPTQPSWTRTSSGFSWEATETSLLTGCDNLDGSTSDDCSNTTHTISSTSSSISQTRSHSYGLLPQTSRHSLLFHQISSDVTSDALLTPSDLYNPFLGFESAISSDTTQTTPHTHRTLSNASEISGESSDLSRTLPVTPVSCIDGEGSQEPLTADKVKDTLRSKLKAKQGTTNFSSHAEGSAKLSQTATGKSSPSCDDCSVTSVVTWSSGQSTSITSRQSSSSRQSPGSDMSQDESTDDTMNDEDDDTGDVLSFPPAHKKRRDNKQEDKNEAVEESEESRLAKREKNRLAAQKCRLRRRDKVETLTQQVQRLEQKQERIKTEVDKLEIEREQLEEMLRLHSFVCKKKL